MSSAPSGPGAGFEPAPGPVGLLIGTKKGAFVLRSSEDRQRWTLEAPQLLGHIVYHVVLDPRDGRSLLATANLGPTICRADFLPRSLSRVRARSPLRAAPAGTRRPLPAEPLRQLPHGAITGRNGRVAANESRWKALGVRHARRGLALARPRLRLDPGP